MIRPESFAVETATFASGRRKIMESSAERLTPHIKEALSRLGLPSWEYQIVNAALDVFDETARSEVDAWGPVLDDMRDLFAKELGESLAKTKKSENPAAQLATITNWVAAMAVNAGTEAATTADTSPGVGLEWITMHDGDVRSLHVEANGQTVPTGHAFSIGDAELMYPGQPVGKPENWINCRCTVRPVMLDGFSSNTITASAEKPSSTSVIVALPKADDAVNAVSSEADGAHATLVFLGESDQFDPADIHATLAELAATFTPLTDPVNGTALLGEHKADVALLDAKNLQPLRAALLTSDHVAERHAAVEQFPTWLPHVTLGYPETPRLSDAVPTEITFDRLALWHGEDRTEYPLGGTVSTEASIVAAVPDATVPASAPVDDGTVPELAPVALTPWHGVLAPEGVPSGDGRQFALGALTNRDLPLPLKAMFIDDDGHKGSVIVGRIDAIFRDQNLVKASGVLDTSADAFRAQDLLEKKMWRGVSVDVDSAEITMADDGVPQNLDVMEFSTARIASATLCAIPAFAEAWVALGEWPAEGQTEAAPAPIPEGAVASMASVSLVASAAATEVLPADFFRNPELSAPTAMTVTEDGRVFGHLAAWDTCHIGYTECVTAPSSVTDYAWFHLGEVITDAGPVAVGHISLGGGHASGTAGIQAALAHYDSTSSVVADITVGEDEHGIWFSGALREGLTSKQLRELRSAVLSGDWRGVRYRGQENYEMIAALAVNVPGFPVPRASLSVANGRQMSLVAAGVVERKPVEFDADFVAKLEAYNARQERVEKVRGIKASIRKERVADIKNNITTLKGK
jgi:2'-5' RNA ligase